jgi:hypothetical protein
MTQSLFFFLIYVLGGICSLPWVVHIPIWLLVSNGFLWGMLIITTSSMIILTLGLNYSFASLLLFCVPFLVLSFWGMLRWKIKIQPKEWQFILIYSAVVAVVLAFATHQTVIYASNDSLYIIYHGRILADFGFLTWTSDQFTEWGIIVPVFQMASVLFEGDFITGYQALITLALLSTLSISIFHIVKQQSPLPHALGWALCVLALMMTPMLVRHTVFIHSNLVAAAFLLVAVYAYWRFLQTDVSAWFILGTISIIAMSFTRAEGVLHALFFLSIVVGLTRGHYKLLLMTLTPYLLLSLLWHLYLYVTLDDYGLLSPTNLIIMMLALVGFWIFIAIRPMLERWLSALPRLVLLGMVTLIIIAFFFRPVEMFFSIYRIIQNLTSVEFWGASWLFIVAVIPLFLFSNLKVKDNSRLLIYCIVGYVLFIIMLAISRSPYRYGDTDSANRLMLHIQPIVLLYMAIRYSDVKTWLGTLTEISDKG